MNCISIFMMILMTDLSGIGSYLLWRRFSRWMEHKGRIWGVRACLAAVLGFFLVPTVFFYMAFRTNLFLGSVSGSLFMRTPFLVNFTGIVVFIWLVGFLYQLMKDARIGYRFHSMLQEVYPAEPCIQRKVDTIRGNMQIRRPVQAYQIPAEIVPVIVGCWRPKILLPDKSFEPDELRMILEHELWHCKQGDLLLKRFCLWIVRLHWFNPIVRKLSAEVDKWGDAHCDLRLCHEGHHWNGRDYFLTVARNGRGAILECPVGMGLRTSIDEIKERAVRMKRYNEQREWRTRSSLLAVALCFILLSSFTAMAAGSGLEVVYDKVYDETLVILEAEPQPEPEVSEEREWLPDADMVIIREEENMNARSSQVYSWDISAGVLRETGRFYASKGNKVTISVTSDPIDASTGIGLDQPNGYLLGVSGSGAYSYTFTVKHTGYHRAYVRNESGKAITATAVVVR